VNSLEEALRNFDGKATTILTEIRATFGNEGSLLSDLVPLIAHSETQVSVGATWLIKDLLDDNMRLTPSQIEDLVGHLHAATSWQAQLHLCQSIRHIEIPEHLTTPCADWLMPLLQSDRPFLRAWSMDALQHLASRNKKLRAAAGTALDAAEQDPAASVRARARNCRKQAKRG